MNQFKRNLFVCVNFLLVEDFMTCLMFIYRGANSSWNICRAAPPCFSSSPNWLWRGSLWLGEGKGLLIGVTAKWHQILQSDHLDNRDFTKIAFRNCNKDLGDCWVPAVFCRFTILTSSMSYVEHAFLPPKSVIWTYIYSDFL